MDAVEVVVAHAERATLRVGDVFLKIDPDAARSDREVAAMALAPAPTAPVLWRTPPVLALGTVPGQALGRLDAPSDAPPSTWRAVGAALRTLHDGEPPPWPGPNVADRATRLDEECAWLESHETLPAADIHRARELALSALRPWDPVFTHGDLQIAHVFTDGDEVTGILDWSEAAPGDALFDLATLTLAHEAHLDDLLEGYGKDVDRSLIRAWWAWRCLVVIRWLSEHGFGPIDEMPEVAVLRSLG